jgi:hypothetical protein
MPYPHIVSPTSSAGSGTSAAQYRRLLAEQLGFWAETVVTETATTGDTARVVLADELRDDEAGLGYLGQAGSDNGPYGAWLYARTGNQAGTQRRLVQTDTAGYLGSQGALVLSRPCSAPIAAGSVVEITAPLPCRSLLSVKGLDTLVNEALDRCWIEAQITLTGNGTDQYDLGAVGALELPARQTRGISDTRWGSSGDAPSVSGGRYRFIVNGVAQTLVTETIYSVSQTFTLDVVVPASRLVFDGTGWALSSRAGLVGDDQQAAAPERWVTTLGMVKGVQEIEKLAVAAVGQTRLVSAQRLALRDRITELRTQRATWAAAARAICQYEMPKTGGGSQAFFGPSSIGVPA